MPTDLTAIDIFSGPGGLTLGMKKAGVRPVMGVEFSKDAVATYKHHTPDSDHRCADIRDVDFRPYEDKVDLVYGGPPCQPFSLGGLRQGHADDRDMVPQFVRAISEVRPQAFVMENVPGLLTSRYRPYFDWMISELEGAGFVCSWQVLSAADYGVPQRRRRVIVVGMRDQIFRFPAPTHGPGRPRPYLTSSTILGPDPIGEPARSPVLYAPVVDLRPNPYHGHIYKGGGRPIDPDAPCQTIYASAGGNKTHWVDVEGIVPEYHAHLKRGGAPREGAVPGARRLSVEESALIQTFPADLTFHGSRSSQYTQVGDAVPVLLAEAVGSALVSQLTAPASTDIAFLPGVGVQQTLVEVRMPRNVMVEGAVDKAIESVDDAISGKASTLPPPKLRKAIDAQIDGQRASVRLASLFLLAYAVVDKTWDGDSVPVGLRGTYGDKKLASAMSIRDITLHDNITAYGENLGWKGNVQSVRLSADPRFREFAAAVKSSSGSERLAGLGYFAGRFAQTRQVKKPLPPLPDDVLSFARARALLYDLIGIKSEGHIQQFVVAGLLRAHRRRVGHVIRTHHPHASDTFDRTAGDIEEFREGSLVAAYEVTVRDDWKNRLQDFRQKMAKAGLNKYWIIASEVYSDPDLADPRQMLVFVEPADADIAIVDLRAFVDVFAAELTASELRDVVNEVYADLANPKLSGRQSFTDAYKDAVGGWLDAVSA